MSGSDEGKAHELVIIRRRSGEKRADIMAACGRLPTPTS